MMGTMKVQRTTALNERGGDHASQQLLYRRPVYVLRTPTVKEPLVTAGSSRSEQYKDVQREGVAEVGDEGNLWAGSGGTKKAADL